MVILSFSHAPHSSTFNYTTDGEQNITDILADELKGELCYIQTSDGRIVAIHHGMTGSHDGINIKRSIVSTFQANFNGSKQDVKETDQGSIHNSHYKCIHACMHYYSYRYVKHSRSHYHALTNDFLV